MPAFFRGKLLFKHSYHGWLIWFLLSMALLSFTISSALLYWFITVMLFQKNFQKMYVMKINSVSNKFRIYWRHNSRDEGSLLLVKGDGKSVHKEHWDNVKGLGESYSGFQRKERWHCLMTKEWVLKDRRTFWEAGIIKALQMKWGACEKQAGERTQ